MGSNNEGINIGPNEDPSSFAGAHLTPSVKYVEVRDQAGGHSWQDVNVVIPQQMRTVPHRHVGAIICVGPSGLIQYGTGTLISGNIVLTCAHVIYSKQYKAYYPKIVFYLGLSGDMKLWYEVQDYAAPEEYGEQKDENKKYDYALLKLKITVEETNYMVLSSNSYNIDSEEDIQFYGYPTSKYERVDNKPRGSKQYGLKRQGRILEQLPQIGLIMHRISSEEGQSGAAVLRTNASQQKQIIGIHVGSTTENLQKFYIDHPELSKINLIKVLDDTIIEKLREFVTRLNGQMFKFRRTGDPEPQPVVIFEELLQEEQNSPESSIFKSSLQSKHKKLKPLSVETNKIGVKSSNNPEDYIEQQRVSEKSLMDSQSRREEKANKYFDQACNYRKEKQYEKQISCYSKILQFSPERPGVHNRIGMALLSQKKYQQAIQQFKAQIKINPGNPKANNNLGTTYIKTGDYKQAKYYLQQAVNLNPDYAEARSNLGYALASLGQCNEAISVLEYAIVMKGTNAKAYKNLGFAHEKNGQYEEAIQNYLQAIERDPRLKEAYENLQYIFQNKCKKVEVFRSSLNFFEEKHEKFPENDRIKHTIEVIREELKTMEN